MTYERGTRTGTRTPYTAPITGLPMGPAPAPPPTYPDRTYTPPMPPTGSPPSGGTGIVPRSYTRAGSIENPSAQIVIPSDSEGGLEFDSQIASVITEGGRPGGRVIGFIYKWRWLHHGSPGGLEKTYGDLHADYDRLSSGTIDGRWPRHGFLPLLTTSAATPDPTGSLSGLHWQNIFGTLIMGLGGGANVSLIKPTSGTDPTPAAITYTPGAVISCLGTIIIGGASAAKRLIVGRTASAAQIISDASGTVDATMHANTANLWGHIQTALDGFPSLLYTNGGLSTLAIDAATGDAPTVALSNVPNGGYALGLLARGGGSLRAYFVLPQEQTATGILLSTSEKAGKVVHFNQEGTDPTDMTPSDFLGIADIKMAAIWQDGVVVSDGKRIVFNNDVSKWDMGWAREREADSDYEYRCRNFYVKGAELIVEVNKIPSTGSGASATLRWLESFDPRTHAWNPISGSLTLSTSGTHGVIGAGGGPIDTATGYLYGYVDGSWRYKFEAPYGINPYTMFRKTSGAGANTGQVWETSATSKTPKFAFRGLQGWPSVVSRISPLGDLAAGGAATSVKYTCGGVNVTFGPGTTDVMRRASFPNNTSFVYLQQLQIDITQGSDTRMTPNVVPVLIEGYTFVGVPPRAPKFINDESVGLQGIAS